MSNLYLLACVSDFVAKILCSLAHRVFTKVDWPKVCRSPDLGFFCYLYEYWTNLAWLGIWLAKETKGTALDSSFPIHETQNTALYHPVRQQNFTRVPTCNNKLLIA